MEVGLSIVILFITLYLWSSMLIVCRKKKRRKILDSGIEADATMLTIQFAYAGREEEVLRGQIRVEPLRGRNYIVELRVYRVEFDSRLKVGSRILIKYLPANRKLVVLSKVLTENQ